jgi:hypothetical protein
MYHGVFTSKYRLKFNASELIFFIRTCDRNTFLVHDVAVVTFFVMNKMAVKFFVLDESQDKLFVNECSYSKFWHENH